MIITTIITTACSKSNDDNDGTTSATIAPPAWIQGTWLDEETLQLTNNRLGFNFKSDDFCQITSIIESCYKSYVDQNTATVSQTVSDTSYKITIKILGNSYVFAFTKKSDTQIEHEGKIYTKKQ